MLCPSISGNVLLFRALCLFCCPNLLTVVYSWDWEHCFCPRIGMNPRTFLALKWATTQVRSERPVATTWHVEPTHYGALRLALNEIIKNAVQRAESHALAAVSNCSYRLALNEEGCFCL